jgi:hypothetical protein
MQGVVMSALSPKARNIVRAGRASNRPTAADRLRIQIALRARLGPELWFPEPSEAATRPRRPLSTSSVVCLGLIGGALLVAARPTPEGARHRFEPAKLVLAKRPAPATNDEVPSTTTTLQSATGAHAAAVRPPGREPSKR